MSSTITSSSALEHEESSHPRKQDVHQKMLRGNIACAECRRLKQRCDRKLPCSTCIQRKCEAVCPIGTLSNGQHRKELHMASNQLRVTVSEMTHRITKLEEALQVEFRSHSEGVHPLLSSELLDVKRCGIDGSTHEEIEELEVINSMGLLALNEPEDDGGKFYGATGKERALLIGAGVTLPREAAFLSHLPRSTREDQHWPFRNTANASPGELHAILELQLPSLQRALALSESFFDNLAKSFQLVSRERVLDFLIPKAYETRPVCFFMAKIDLHDLALLYMVFALGISVDPSNPASTAEGERYRHLARASLGLKCIFENTSLAAIQTICLMSCYNVIASNAGNNEEAWRMMYLAFNLGLSVGLHRDPARWYLSPDEIAARRLLFWEMYVVDIRKSIASGRPPRFSLETVDCEFPPDTEAVLNPDGSTSSSCWHMNFLLSKTVIAPIAKRLSAAQPPKYSELLEMDRQIREFDLSQTSSSQAPPDLKAHSHCIYGSCVLTLRDLTLLYLHRAYFAKALLDSPEDPLRSPYAASFLAAYRSAASVIRTLKRKLCVSPRLVLRHWPTWAHALCSSVMVGSIVIRSPSSCMAPLAFRDLEIATSLFQDASDLSIPQSGLPILLRILDKARRVLDSSGGFKKNEERIGTVDIYEEAAPLAEQSTSNSTPARFYPPLENAIGLVFESSSIGSEEPPSALDSSQASRPAVNLDVPDYPGWDAAQWENIWQSLVTQSDFASEEELRNWNLC